MTRLPANPPEVRRQVESMVGGLADTPRLTLICGSDDPEQALCVLDDVPETAMQCVIQAIGGHELAFSSIAAFIRLSPEFSCPARPGGCRLVAASCFCKPKG